MMSLVLRQDGAALLERVSADAESAKTYGEASAWFRRESSYLRKTAGMLDNAADRLTTVLECRERKAAEVPAAI